MIPCECFDKTLKLEDGIKLISRIWRPKGEGSWPTLLMRQPYGRHIASTITYAHPNWWASNGYMVVIQDVRGQGDSEGEFKGFSQEADDTSATHEWVRSLDSCNGKLGLYGFSYQGLTQITGNENSKPPDCLAPAMTGLDIKNHWCSHGNAFWWQNNIAWALQLASFKLKRKRDSDGWQQIRMSLENKTYLQEGLSLIKKYDPDNFVIKWIELLDKEEIFEEIKTVPSWFRKPMLIYGGLWDPHLTGALDLYQKSKDYGGDPEIYIGNASHLNWWEGSQETLLSFFDKHLKRETKKGTKSEKKIWDLTLNHWEDIRDDFISRQEFTFNSEGSANFETQDGSLSINSEGSGYFSIVHDPWRPVPSNGGHLGQNPGLTNRAYIDQRLDVGVFQTFSLEEDTKISGIPVLKTLVFSDLESFDICLALSFVKNNNSVNQFCTGFLRARNSKRDKGNFCSIRLQPTNITIKRGDKLRLSISAAAWPAIGVNPGNGENRNGSLSVFHKINTLSFDLKNTIMKIEPFF